MLNILPAAKRPDALGNTAFLLPAEQALPLLHDEPIAFLSHPLFYGLDIAIVVTFDSVYLQAEGLDQSQVQFVHDAYLCERTKLQELLRRVHNANKCDRMLIDCRFVHVPDWPARLDPYRLRVYTGERLVRQYPYQFCIFEDDARPPRFLTYLSTELYCTNATLMQGATDCMATDARDSSDLELGGLIWIPLLQTDTVPSLLTHPSNAISDDLDPSIFYRRLRKGTIDMMLVDGAYIKELDSWKK